MTPDFRHRIEYKEYVETTQFSARITVLSVFGAAVLVGYLLCFYYVQVIQSDHYAELAEANRARRVLVPPPRGALMDRYGRVIARNRPSFDVMLDREKASGLDGTLRTLAPVLQLDLEELKERIVRVAERPVHEPVVIGTDVSLRVAAFIEARRADLPGISVHLSTRRFYPEGASGSHLIGYVGEITRAMLESPQFAGNLQGDIVGRSGVERTYEADLQGHRGERRVIVNSSGRVMGEMAGSVEPVPGRDVPLTINLDMQRALDEAFGDRVGAGVFMDPRTGEILAMTSRPGFDPNFFARRFSRQVWRSLVDDPRHPLQNRAIQSAYSPGSTFKPIVAAAALEEGVATESTVVHCAGSAVFHGRRFHCHKRSGHGSLGMKRAIMVSCNIYFYTLGSRLGIESIARYAGHLGLGSATGVDLLQEHGGLVPTPEWKMRVHRDRWYPSETVSVSIGQGPLLITPLQMAMVQGVIATDGRRVTPHLRKGGGGEPSASIEENMISHRSLTAIREAEWSVVNDWGTGRAARIPGRDVCGKTGTAQVYAASATLKDEELPPEMRDHAWFVGFAPRDDPKVSFAVIVEHGGHGGDAAAPIVKSVLEKFFESEGRQEPVPTPPTDRVAHAAETDAGVL